MLIPKKSTFTNFLLKRIFWSCCLQKKTVFSFYLFYFLYVKTALFPSIHLLEVFLAFSFILSCQYTRNIISYPFELKTRKRSKDEYRTISFPQKTKNGRNITTVMWGYAAQEALFWTSWTLWSLMFIKILGFWNSFLTQIEHSVRFEEKYCALGNNPVWPDIKETRIGRTYYFHIPPPRLKQPT
jgi:hypothetical protein